MRPQVPEFLREGSAVHDFLNPDRIVVGCDRADGAERVAALYARLGAPTVLTDSASAELVKYAANCFFLAMKLSYVNAMAELCERVGADITDVTEGMGYDRRIGQAFLKPGPGWGGSCLPKDTHGRQGPPGRDREPRRFPVPQAARVKQAGAELAAYDPALVAADVTQLADLVSVVDSPLSAAADADAVVVLTDWPEFRGLDWVKIADAMRGPVVVDTRNLIDRDVLSRAGLHCHSLGRPSVTAAGPQPAAG